MNIKKEISILLVLLVLVSISLGACGKMNNPYEIIISKLIYENGKFDHGEVLRIDQDSKEQKIEDFSLIDASSIGNGCIIGEYDWGKNDSIPIAIYDIKSKTVKTLTAIEADINNQMFSVNEDGSAVYFVEQDMGLVRYDILSGEKKIICGDDKIRFPQVSKDEKYVYFTKRGNIVKYDIQSKNEDIIIKDVFDFDLSLNGDFIIFARGENNGAKTSIYKYDVNKGQEENLIEMNDYAFRISIAEDGSKFLYVTNTEAYFSEWAKTIIHVYDLDTNSDKIVFKSKSFGALSLPIIDFKSFSSIFVIKL